MKLLLGETFEECPVTWQNMVSYLRSTLGVDKRDEWGEGWVIIDNYLYENFCGKLNRLDEEVSYVEFESDAHYTWFVLRYS